MSTKSPRNEMKLLTIEEVNFDLPEVEPQPKEKKEIKEKKYKSYIEESIDSKEKKEKKNNRIKR